MLQKHMNQLKVSVINLRYLRRQRKYRKGEKEDTKQALGHVLTNTNIEFSFSSMFLQANVIRYFNMGTREHDCEKQEFAFGNSAII